MFNEKLRTLKIGLVPRILIAMALGIAMGLWLPAWFNQIIITGSTIYGTFMSFFIPLMILAFVTLGIADLSQGAGKLLGFTALLSYGSTLLAGAVTYFAAITLFPLFLTGNEMSGMANLEESLLNSYITFTLPPVMDTLSAVVLAFMLGLSISALKGGRIGHALYDVLFEFSEIIQFVLKKVIIPFLPLYICGTMINLTVSGEVFVVVGVLWEVFIIVVLLQFLDLLLLFSIAGTISHKNPLALMKNQIPGYTTAIGTQSSAATIPVNLECAEKNGVSEEIRNFTIPLCANIHMAGSMITVTACCMAVLLMNQMDHGLGLMLGFIMTLGFAMVAAPGAPGGAIMTALPFLSIIGIAIDSPLASLMIAIYISQDSFATACNVSGDNAISLIVQKFYDRMTQKKTVIVEGEEVPVRT